MARRFYNCEIILHDHNDTPLGNLFYSEYKPDTRFVGGYLVFFEDEEVRMTQTVLKKSDSGFYYVIIEDRKNNVETI